MAKNEETCVTCGKNWSPDCPSCRERRPMTPLRLQSKMPWPTHEPAWINRDQSGMLCNRCGLPIRPEMTMRELFGPCSARVEA